MVNSVAVFLIYSAECAKIIGENFGTSYEAEYRSVSFGVRSPIVSLPTNLNWLVGFLFA